MLSSPADVFGDGSGFNDHQSLLGACATAGTRGSGAPRFIHSTRSAASPSGNAFFGGIALSGSRRRTAFTRRLSSGLPGMTGGPDSPPWLQPLLESSASPPFILPEAW